MKEDGRLVDEKYRVPRSVNDEDPEDSFGVVAVERLCVGYAMYQKDWMYLLYSPPFPPPCLPTPCVLFTPSALRDTDLRSRPNE